MMDIHEVVEWSARTVEILGIIVIGGGTVLMLLIFLTKLRGDISQAYRELRHNLGKAILLGLEILVAADIIATVVTEPTMEQVLTLGLIVLIRTFLSFSLETELEGRVPWKRGEKKKN